jgi:hypothetical protein
MRLAVTGHRPNKLGGYSTDIYRRLRALTKQELMAFNSIDDLSKERQ